MTPTVATTLPLRHLDHVEHVGTLNPADKGIAHASYEGAGLSVSLDPAAWEAIARLGGHPWWTLRRTDSTPGRFLEAHDLNDAAKEHIIGWGRDNSYVTDRVVHTVTHHDCELEADITYWHDDLVRAEEEAEDYETTVESDIMAVATDQLLNVALQRPGQLVSATFLLLPVFVEQATDLDGVWWDDLNDPARLSAPRGVIVPSRVAEWTPTRMPSRQVPHRPREGTVR